MFLNTFFNNCMRCVAVEELCYSVMAVIYESTAKNSNSQHLHEFSWGFSQQVFLRLTLTDIEAFSKTFTRGNSKSQYKETLIEVEYIPVVEIKFCFPAISFTSCSIPFALAFEIREANLNQRGLFATACC